jgi:hypothetical protein
MLQDQPVEDWTTAQIYALVQREGITHVQIAEELQHQIGRKQSYLRRRKARRSHTDTDDAERLGIIYMAAAMLALTQNTVAGGPSMLSVPVPPAPISESPGHHLMTEEEA